MKSTASSSSPTPSAAAATPSGEGMKFRRLGGSFQLVIENSEDIARVPELDPAHWAMTSIRIDSMVCDREFLTFMDSDRNGKIRTDEVKNAIRWMLSLLKDRSGIDSGSAELKLSAVNDSLPEGREILETMRIVLLNLNLPAADRITAEQIRDSKKIMANSMQNGDGVIPPSAIPNPDLSAFAAEIMNLFGKVQDITGADGIRLEQLENFEKSASAYLAWLAEAELNASVIRPFGNATDSVYAAFQELREKIDDFFLNCQTLEFCPPNRGRCRTESNTFDPLDPATVNAFLEKALLCEPNGEGILKLCSGEEVNPLWRSKLAAFSRLLAPVYSLQAPNLLTQKEWEELKRLLSPFGAWMGKKNTTLFDKADPILLKKRLEDGGPTAKLREMMENDKAVGKNILLCETVKKLLLYQQNMLEFLNNFVCMHHLFDPRVKSMLQAGRLVMDGRHFTLVTLVGNSAEHKSIAKNSDICVMYITVTTGEPDKLRSMSLSVAVTSGHMRNLFIGKSGVFFTPDGVVWDAKVTDFIQQPVSISEAMSTPFYRFGDFIGKQADKFFTARSKNFEKEVETQFQSTALPGGTAAAAAPPKAAPQQTPALSGSMVLMGGGVGIAAIGSAFALIANMLQNISLWKILAIFLGILLVFGGPVVFVSLVKLYHRNLSLFLEANGYALNRKMRLSRKMGAFFTYVPSLPELRLICPEKIVNMLAAGIQEREKTAKRKRRLILLILLLFLAGFFLGMWIFSRLAMV